MHPVSARRSPITVLSGPREETRPRGNEDSVRSLGRQSARSVVGHEEDDRRGNVQDRSREAVADEEVKRSSKIDETQRIPRAQGTRDGAARVVQTMHEGEIHSTVFSEHRRHVFPLGDRLHK